jgi:hypothetical protein
MIEDAKATLRTWGAADPTFLLCNSKLTFQMTMIPEKTQYLTQGPDGSRRLKDGPNINTYRGLHIINSRSFSMEDGAPPRDVLRRRVRVAEYYRIPYEDGIEDKSFSFYDESKDAWQKYTWQDLFSMSNVGELDDEMYENRHGRIDFGDNDYEDDDIYSGGGNAFLGKRFKSIPTKLAAHSKNKYVDFKISKDAWNRMKGLDDGVGIDFDPAFDFNDFLGGKKDTDAAVLDVMRVCGLDLDKSIKDKGAHDDKLVKTDEEKYLQSFRAYRKNFCSYVKSWLIGNLVPREVHAFLEKYNWQGIEDNGEYDAERLNNFLVPLNIIFHEKIANNEIEEIRKDKWELVIIRPNIEHNMLGIVMGRGGLDELGATFWGQTELSCFDDSMHGMYFTFAPFNVLSFLDF